MRSLAGDPMRCFSGDLPTSDIEVSICAQPQRLRDTKDSAGLRAGFQVFLVLAVIDWLVSVQQGGNTSGEP